MENKETIEQNLSGFYGTENWYKHALIPSFLYTDGAKYVFTACDAYWLLDKIAAITFTRLFGVEEFIVWRLKLVEGTGGAELTATDANYTTIYTEKILTTDFPLDSIKFYFVDNVLLLPSEY